MRDVTSANERWEAVDLASDRRVLAKRIAEVREISLAGGRLPSRAAPRGVVLRSWGRCRPLVGELTPPPQRYSREEMAERFARSKLAVAEPILRNMLEVLDPADRQLLLVTDAEGTILWTDGAPEALSASEELHVVPGTLWSESACGTNGMGTALAERHAVQIFAFEHLMPGAEAWVCSAAPIRDPETGEQLGVVDLSGEYRAAHPHSLAMVVTAARSVEQLLAQRVQTSRARLRDRWSSRLRGADPIGLAADTGMIVDADRENWVGRRIPALESGEHTVALDGELLQVEPVDGGFLLWRSRPQFATAVSLGAMSSTTAPASLALSALGRDRVLVVDGEKSIELSRRHSEILVLLTMFPNGLTDEQIALKLHGDFGRPVTARAELSRLRRTLAGRVTTTPYRLLTAPQADYFELEDLTRAGFVEEALARYVGPLLPRSENATIVELRERLDHALRTAVLQSRSPEILLRWLELPAGEDDLEACRALIAVLDDGDSRRAAALSRLRRLSQQTWGLTRCNGIATTST
jgi:hypothetical protein